MSMSMGKFLKFLKMILPCFFVAVPDESRLFEKDLAFVTECGMMPGMFETMLVSLSLPRDPREKRTLLLECGDCHGKYDCQTYTVQAQHPIHSL